MDSIDILNIVNHHYSLDLLTAEFLREGGGDTYVASSVEKKYVLKIAKKAFAETVEQSVDIMVYLHGKGFSVPETILSDEGYIVHTDIDGEERLMMLYEYIDGTEPDAEQCGEAIGKLTGQLHKLMEGYNGIKKLTKRGQHFFIDRYIGYLREKGYSDDKLSEYERIGAALWERITDLPYSYSHGDLHSGNMLMTDDGRIFLLDFDTSCVAPRMFDIMVMCDATDYFSFNPNDFKKTVDRFDSFQSGYSEFYQLTDREKSELFDFIGIRHFQLQATICEIFGLDCIDEAFIDKQLEWLKQWLIQCESEVTI